MKAVKVSLWFPNSVYFCLNSSPAWEQDENETKPHQVQMQTAHGTHRLMDRAWEKEIALQTTLKMHIIGFVSKKHREVMDRAPTFSSSSQEAQPEPLGAAGSVFIQLIPFTCRQPPAMGSEPLGLREQLIPTISLISGTHTVLWKDKIPFSKQWFLEVTKKGPDHLMAATHQDFSPWEWRVKHEVTKSTVRNPLYSEFH